MALQCVHSKQMYTDGWISRRGAAFRNIRVWVGGLACSRIYDWREARESFLYPLKELRTLLHPFNGIKVRHKRFVKSGDDLTRGSSFSFFTRRYLQ